MILVKPSMLPESQSSLITPFVYDTFPTTLGFLAGYVREYNKILPRIIDEQNLPLDIDTLKGILSSNKGLKVVGLTVITVNSYRAFKIARLIKEIDKEYLVIFGGIHPTVLPEECLDNRYVDIVVRGEGEESLSELLQRIALDKDYGDIDGISYRKNGGFIHNPNRNLIDLSRVPPFPYDLFDEVYEKYRDFGTVISSRGCPFDCIFCSQRSITKQKFRLVKNERVLQDVEILIKKYKQKMIWFMDDNFLIDKERVLLLLEGIIKNGFHKKACFCAEMRGKSATRDILKKMKEANFAIASFGMETGSQRLLNLINKNEEVEDNIRAVKMAHEVGLSTSATFIFGLPTETREERLATARLARKIPLDDARFNVAVPYPGTKLFEIAKKEKRLFVKEDWSNFNVQFYMFGDDIPYVPENTNKYQLMFDTFMANVRFYLRFNVIINFFSSPIAGGMILTLPKRWYFSLKYLWQFFCLGMYITVRFFRLLFCSTFRFRDRQNRN